MFTLVKVGNCGKTNWESGIRYEYVTLFNARLNFFKRDFTRLHVVYKIEASTSTLPLGMYKNSTLLRGLNSKFRCSFLFFLTRVFAVYLANWTNNVQGRPVQKRFSNLFRNFDE